MARQSHASVAANRAYTDLAGESGFCDGI